MLGANLGLLLYDEVSVMVGQKEVCQNGRIYTVQYNTIYLCKIIRVLSTSETETCVPVHETRQEAKWKLPYKMH